MMHTTAHQNARTSLVGDASVRGRQGRSPSVGCTSDSDVRHAGATEPPVRNGGANPLADQYYLPHGDRSQQMLAGMLIAAFILLVALPLYAWVFR
jgi:hypothetical protein